MIDDISYSLPSESYAEEDSDCTIMIKYDESLDNMIYIGLPFFENFVTVIDYKAGKYMFGMNTNAYEGAMITTPDPWIVDTFSHLSGWAIFGIIAASFLVVSLLMLGIAYCCHVMNKR